MGTWDFLVVRVSVGRAVEVKAHQNDSLPRPVLIGGLRQLDLAARDVEHEILALFRRNQRNREPAAGFWECTVFIIGAEFFHGYQGVGFGLRDVDISH